VADVYTNVRCFKNELQHANLVLDSSLNNTFHPHYISKESMTGLISSQKGRFFAFLSAKKLRLILFSCQYTIYSLSNDSLGTEIDGPPSDPLL